MLNWKLIQDIEGFRTTGYVPDQGSSQSGVTIGYGVDLGHWSEAQLRRRKVSPHLIDKLRPFLGLRGDDAIEVADELVLHEDDARNLSSRIQGDIVATLMGRYARAQRAGTLRWDYLPSAVQTVIVSVAFQYGPALARRTPKFWRAAVANDWSGMVAELRDFGDRYPTRRGKEADYLDHILKT